MSATFEATSHRSETTIADELARLDQSLVDLHAARAASVSLIHCPSRARERSMTSKLSKRAKEKRWVVARISMEEFAFDYPEELVRELLINLSGPDMRKAGSILALLDRFGDPSEDTAARFATRVAEEHAHGDLSELCHAYLKREDEEGRHETRAIDAWLNGELGRGRAKNPRVRRPLDSRTAQRTLAQLSRVILALGYKGLVVFLSEGDQIAKRSKTKRERCYTVLRELVDNFDGTDGAAASRIYITGMDDLFSGPKSLESLPPLMMRLTIPSSAEPVPPHRTWTSLVREPYEYRRRAITQPPERKLKALRSVIRISGGLPPTEALASMSVRHDKVEKTIDNLFDHMDIAGSAFQMLVGEYGSGKTHIMMHLAERALDDNRPVFWLNVERMNMDLGHPPKHLSRLLTNSVLPLRGRPTAESRAGYWTRSASRLAKLRRALEEIEAIECEEAFAAEAALDCFEQKGDVGLAVENYLTGVDLIDASGSKSKRRNAYRRLLLWIELLQRLEGTNGAVLLIDEAENLYTTRTSWSARRTALRSLSFYCGGALPGSAVVMAMTPPAYEELRGEAALLLQEADESTTTLQLEDVELFARRLAKLRPTKVPRLNREQREVLVDKVRRTHRSVRGPVELEDWQTQSQKWAKELRSPRVLIRTVIDQLESAWWSGY